MATGEPMAMPTPMDEAQCKLLAWFSPGYPVGSFAYSQGLERAAEAGAVHDRGSLTRWLEDGLERGAARTDAILLALAYRAAAAGDAAGLADIAALAAALALSAERRLETVTLGAAFAAVTAAAWAPGPAVAPYPVALGEAAARHRLPLKAVVAAFLQAYAANLVSAAVRLGVVGQTDGQRVAAALVPVCLSVAADALAAGIDEIGGCTLRADIASMQHETQATRLFRS